MVHNEDQRYWLCISLRGSQRVATGYGARLDRISQEVAGFTGLRGWLNEKATDATGPGLEALLVENKATHSFGRQASRMFDGWRHAAIVDAPPCSLSVDGIKGTFQVDNATAWRSAAASFESIEGEDILFILELCPVQAQAATSISSRPVSQDAAVALLKNLGVVVDHGRASLGTQFRPGFYLLPGAQQAGSGAAGACVVACLFYCYLVCQRIERLLNDVSANGDWDMEYRKLLLIRKKLLAVRKCALLKNRALPGSALLACFLGALTAFRLSEQIEHLAAQADFQAQVLEAHSTYIESRRIKSIETIVFAGTLLSLAVGINAIQMAPFFDQGTTNALLRPIFWVVVAVVGLGGVLLWGSISNWPYCRQWVARLTAKREESS